MLVYITICPENFGYDKWAFIRLFLSQFSFICDTLEECEKTEAIRKLFNETLQRFRDKSVSLINTVIANNQILIDKEEEILDCVFGLWRKSSEKCGTLVNFEVSLLFRDIRDAYLEKGRKGLREMEEALDNHIIGKEIFLYTLVDNEEDREINDKEAQREIIRLQIT